MEQALIHDNLGGYLKYSRENLRLQLNDIAHVLHIRAKYLEALEEGRYGELPGRIYMRGYLGAYAEFLGLDRKHVLEEFDQARISQSPRQYYRPNAQALRTPPHAVFVWTALILLAGLALWQARESVAPALALREIQETWLLYDRPSHPCFRGKNMLYPACYDRSLRAAWLPPRWQEPKASVLAMTEKGY